MPNRQSTTSLPLHEIASTNRLIALPPGSRGHPAMLVRVPSDTGPCWGIKTGLGAIPLTLGDGEEFNGGWPRMPNPHIGWTFDPIGVVTGTFHRTRVGAMAFGVEALNKLSPRRLQGRLEAARGKNPPGRSEERRGGKERRSEEGR